MDFFCPGKGSHSRAWRILLIAVRSLIGFPGVVVILDTRSDLFLLADGIIWHLVANRFKDFKWNEAGLRTLDENSLATVLPQPGWRGIQDGRFSRPIGTTLQVQDLVMISDGQTNSNRISQFPIGGPPRSMTVS